MSRTNAAAVRPRDPSTRPAVLVVEDDENLRSAVRAVLEFLDYDVEDVEEPKDALARFRARPARFDVLLTDVKMKGMSGPALARKARSLRPDLPVVFLSGLARDDDLNKPDLRDFPLLAKPVSMATLKTALKQALARSAPGP